ncbi:hypothetical protein [Anaeromicrobium sediminis]|uniref:hypothetical protein n=1 Tax=Anaeromicrobium sediminis TaxID=1478221 RepID=UPI0015963B89|nr:hypothetical protein [Anaeromicrobium sediminis]
MTYKIDPILQIHSSGSSTSSQTNSQNSNSNTNSGHKSFAEIMKKKLDEISKMK